MIVSPPICPYCGNEAKLVDGEAIYGASAWHWMKNKFWDCRPCDAYVGTHKNSKKFVPLGRLANKELRRWKQNAHFVFDPLWKTGNMTRLEAYAQLAVMMEISVEEAHIGKFDVEQCKRLVALFRPKVEEN
jgi:hypothetical protein